MIATWPDDAGPLRPRRGNRCGQRGRIGTVAVARDRFAAAPLSASIMRRHRMVRGFSSMRTLPFVAVTAIALALAGSCFAQSCDPNPDAKAADPENLMSPLGDTGAGGSQSLGAGSNVNGPRVSGVGVSECYAESHYPWATGEAPRKPGGDAPQISSTRGDGIPR
jgi:hypothetical protein